MPTMLLHMAETSTTTIVVVISYIVIAIIVVVVSIEIKCTMKIFIICWHFFLLSTFFFQQHHHHHILSYWCLCKWKGCVRSVLDLAEFRSVSFDSFLSNQQDSATKLRIHFSEREKRENYDVFTVHKINTISPFLEIICQQIFLSWWNFERLLNWDVPRFSVVRIMPISHIHTMPCESRFVVSKQARKKSPIKYSRDFFLCF